MQPVLLFDVMDTLVYNPFNQEIPDFFGISRLELLAVKDPFAWARFETGEIGEAEYLRTCFADRRDFDHAAFLRTVRRAYRWIDGMERLLQHLGNEGFEIHALSNYPVWYRTIEAELALSRFLKWTFVSCRTGVRKPEPAAYLGAAASLQRAAMNCILIDDSIANCRAAEAVGMPAICFRDSASLSVELRQRGGLD